MADQDITDIELTLSPAFEREWGEDEEKTLGMLVAVLREQDQVLLLEAYGPPWNLVLENGYGVQELLDSELKPPSDGVWVAVGDFNYVASGGWECPHEDFDVYFRGEWRKPTSEEWAQLKLLGSEFVWEKKDLPARR